MQNLDNIERVGHGIAVAFVATIYGVAVRTSSFFRRREAQFKHRKRMIIKEMMLEGTSEFWKVRTRE